MIRYVLAAALTVTALPAVANDNIQDVTSPGGIDAWLVEEHSLPFVSLEVRFLGGGSLDLPGKRGATALMTGLLEEGSADMDSRAYSEAREDLAASIGFDIDDDTVSVSARFLTETKAESIELIRAALIEPTFDEDSLERVRGQMLAGIRSRVTDPNAIASDVMGRAAYGDHPYATDLSGTVESVTALTRDDVVQAWENAIARDRVYVSAVGDVTPEELGTMLDTLFADLPETGGAFADEVEFSAEPGVSITPFDTPQSVAIIGQPGMEVTDPDFFAAYVLNTVFGGGGMTTRLHEEVREKRGLTYGIGSYLADNEYSNAYMAQFSSVNSNMAEAVSIVQDEWRKMAEDGITQEELDTAKTYLTGAYPLRFDGNSQIASILVWMQMDGYDTDYPATRNEKVEAVTLEDANRVAAELYQPENLRIVVVGQPEGLEATVE